MTDYTALGKGPIPGDNPAGNDCRYEVEFETLQAEIDKLSSPTAEGKVDWAKVIQWSADILGRQSKDLTVASYLAVGLVRQKQIDGLDEGIQVFKDLAENFWETMYPPKKRMRGRAGALTWWLEKTEEVLESLNPSPLPAEQVQRLQDNIQALDSFLAENMSDPPVLRPLQRQIERFPVIKPEPAREKAAPETAPQSAGPAPAAEDRPVPKPAPPAVQPSPGVEAPQSLSTEQDANKSIDTAIQLFRKASHFFLQQDLKNPSAYRYRRMAGWARIEELPPNSDGVTQIPPPAPQVADAVMELYEAANWPGLMENIEQRVSQFVFWFDLHFLAAEGLKHLGPDYKPALRAVSQETAYFLLRLPGVENLAFSDEKPFADAQTRNWLKSIGFGASHDGTALESGAAEGPQDRVNTVTQEAMAMARKKKVAEGVDLLFQELRRAGSCSEQTRWRLAIARLLMAVKKGSSALPHLEQVICDIDTFRLEQWNPTLALEGLTLAWKGFSAEGNKTHQDAAVELLNRIAKLNPVEALRLAP